MFHCGLWPLSSKCIVGLPKESGVGRNGVLEQFRYEVCITHLIHTHMHMYTHTHTHTHTRVYSLVLISLGTRGLGDYKVARMGTPTTDYKLVVRLWESGIQPHTHTHTHTHTETH